MANSRYIAYKALMRIEKDKAYSNITLDEFLSENNVDSRDRAFISTIFYGVLERKISLDYIISKFSSIRLKKIDIPVLVILRMAVYQLVFMDKVPDNAAVNEAVSLCKKEKLYKSSGFVNGVLRSITRAENRFPLPDPKDKTKYLSIKYSCPENIISLWVNDYSYEIAEDILKSATGRPPIYIRVNTLKTNSDELIKILADDNISASKTYVENALEIKFSGSVADIDSYKKGLFHVQDISSQICCSIANVKDGFIVSDVCSAPGGKTLTLAQNTPNGKIFAYDIYEHKINLIKSSASRMGINNIYASVRNAGSSESPLEMSDVVLCDVPCSGLGVIRRKPEIRYKSDDISGLPEIQLKILEQSAKYVKLGGFLVYSTCTLNKKENNDNAEKFLINNKDFEPVEIKFCSRTINEKPNCLTLFPQTNGSDGFFVALFQRISV